MQSTTTTDARLQAVQRTIEDTEADILQVKRDLSAAADPSTVAFCRRRLEDTGREIVSLREKENIVLRSQAIGQHSCSVSCIIEVINQLDPPLAEVSADRGDVWLPACLTLPWMIAAQLRPVWHHPQIKPTSGGKFRSKHDRTV